MTIHFATEIKSHHRGRVFRLSEKFDFYPTAKLLKTWDGMTDTRSGRKRWRDLSDDQKRFWNNVYSGELTNSTSKLQTFLNFAKQIHPAEDVTLVDDDDPPVRYVLKEVLEGFDCPYVGAIDSDVIPRNLNSFGKSATIKALNYRAEAVSEEKARKLLKNGLKFPQIFGLSIGKKMAYYHLKPIESKEPQQPDSDVLIAAKVIAQFFGGDIAKEANEETFQEFGW